MNRSDWTRWALLVVSAACSVTTVVTVLLVVLNVMGWLGAVLLALGLGKGAAEGGGLLMAVFSVGSFVLSAPIAVCSVVLHAVGGAAALASTRFGARMSAYVFMGFHAVTFVVGLMVLLYWTVGLLTAP